MIERKNNIFRDITIIIILVIILLLLNCIETNKYNEIEQRLQSQEKEIDELWDCIHALDEQYVQLHGEVYNNFE